jgi:carbon storage regulator
MLVLTRKIGERIVIDNRIVIEVVQVKGNRIRLGIQAPDDAVILREELLQNPKASEQTEELAHSP